MEFLRKNASKKKSKKAQKMHIFEKKMCEKNVKNAKGIPPYTLTGAFVEGSKKKGVLKPARGGACLPGCGIEFGAFCDSPKLSFLCFFAIFFHFF